MTLAQAKAECNRWFEYIAKQQLKASRMQSIASLRRLGKIDEDEARRRVRALDSGVTVYDGANLEKAVRVLLKHVQ